MRTRTRHPRLEEAACLAYGIAIWLFPSEFRRDFGHELAVTFRNNVQDALERGSILQWLGFAAHIVLDWLRTRSMLLLESHTYGSESMLGLSDGDTATGRSNRTTIDVSFVFAAAGLVLSCAGWYAYFVILPTYFHVG